MPEALSVKVGADDHPEGWISLYEPGPEPLEIKAEIAGVKVADDGSM